MVPWWNLDLLERCHKGIILDSCKKEVHLKVTMLELGKTFLFTSFTLV